MNQPHNPFDLTPEQRDTLALLHRLFGKAIADRYADLCLLAAGAFDLHVARPNAAHALRELDSMLRHVLEVPMDAKAANHQDNAEKIEKARKDLVALGFDEGAIQRAGNALKPALVTRIKSARSSRASDWRRTATWRGAGGITVTWNYGDSAFNSVGDRSFLAPRMV